MCIPDERINLEDEYLDTQRHQWLTKWISRLSPQEQVTIEDYLDGKPGRRSIRKILVKLRRSAYQDHVNIEDLGL